MAGVDVTSIPIVVIGEDTPTSELHEAMTHLAREAKKLSRVRRDHVERWIHLHDLISQIQDILATRGADA